MISEILTQHTWLWPVVWQSTTILVLGLLGSFVLRRRAARAHQLLLLALVAVLAVPVLSGVVKQHQWGLLRAEAAVSAIEHRPAFAMDERTESESTQPREQASARATATAPSVSAPALPAVEIQWSRLTVQFWLALSAVLFVRLAIRFFLGYRLARRSVTCEVKKITRAVQGAKIGLGISGDVDIRRSADTRSPVIWCWGMRPVLLVPAETKQSDNVDWESVVCHELAHWKRRDHLGGLWAEFIVCLLPWNPLSWWAQRRLVCLSEEACDDWVIASGQIGTRYARTLLGLTPQGRAALIPAVVSSRRGLAARVRRILADQCTSPRSGLRWSLAAVGLAGSLALGIAFAQTRPAEPSGMTKTTLAHGAVIEQLASTGTIKGVVLDPNGQPTPERTTGIAVLPMTCHSTSADEKGQFEIQWSPSWIEPGQPIHLVARNGHHHLARIVAVTDPTAPVTIKLTPALTISGQVFDSTGLSIDKGTAALSLPVRFNCRAPIAAADIGPEGRFTIHTVPAGKTYTLEISAEGCQSRQITITATSEDANEIDLGSITLPPQDPTRPDVIALSPNPKWKDDFDKIYRLSEDETVKLIKVPFPFARQDRLMDMTRHEGASDDMLDFAHIYTQYRWNGSLKEGWWYANDLGSVRILTVLLTFLDIPSYEFELPEELADTHVARGDWIVRKHATTEEKMLALQEITQAQLQRPIRFEKRRVDRDTIVVTGRYAYTPLPGADPNRLYLIADKMEHLDSGEAESLSQLFAWLANGIKIAIDDQTEPTEKRKILYSHDWDLLNPPMRADPIDKEKALPLLLDNLAKQTGLTFKVEKRPADVWFITEEKEEAAVAGKQSSL